MLSLMALVRLKVHFLFFSLQKKSSSITRFSKSDHDTLADIFKKIGQKELTKVGLRVTTTELRERQTPIENFALTILNVCYCP